MAYTAFMRITRSNNRTVTVAALALLAMLAFVVRFGLSLETLQYVALTALLGWVPSKDLRSRTIPNTCILACVGVRAAYFAALVALGVFDAGRCIYYVVSGLGIGVALLLFGLVFERITGREGMGGGDVKLYAIAGLFLGFDGSALAVLISCIVALVAALLTKSSHDEGVGFSRTLPFGPAIAASVVLVALMGLT